MQTALIIGGTGQLGRTLKLHLIKKKIKPVITTRYKKNELNKKNFVIVKLDIYNKNEIYSLIFNHKPKFIFYFSGQSSPSISFFKKNETIKSNYIGCRNFLDVIKKNNFDVKFFNATSSEIFAYTKKKITSESLKKTNSPYGYSKLKSFNITKKYRNKYKLKTFNIIFFNTESIYRNKKFLIPKICMAAINAKKFKKKTSFGNLNVVREWNWADDQCRILIKFLDKKPQDFILSNGKRYSVLEMIKFAFEYFSLNHEDYIMVNKKLIRKKEVIEKKSNYKIYLRKNKIKEPNFIFGKKLIHKIIEHILKGSKNF